MKFSESWLREWVDPPVSREMLCQALTMAGIEVEELAPVAKPFSGVVIGEVIQIEKHPEADRLNVCTVKIKKDKSLRIVCGATNVTVGMKAPVATIGAELPNGMTIKPTTIRGVASEGMLCSASELGLAEESTGLLELPASAPIGEDLRKLLDLNDYTIDLSVTPNRGDCLSIKGVAREVSAITKTKWLEQNIKAIRATIKDSLSITIEDQSGCPHYVGRIIRDVKADAESPIWLKERLRRGGIRSISAIVDITNYVMLELGQPMHAFDLNTIQQGIKVRLSKKGEKIALLDGSEKILDNKTLVIADQTNPLAIAGVMGGIDSSVTLLTRDIFLESAYFSPQTIARQRQCYQLNSDSAYRFERGVDPAMQQIAIERATQLIMEVAGGKPGPVSAQISKQHLPPQITIELSKEKLQHVLGIEIPDKEVKAIFKRLGFAHQIKTNAFIVQVPSYRSDLALPEDIIEEIARLYGYDNIPTHAIRATLGMNTAIANAPDLRALYQVMQDAGYHEIITYSFVDKQLQTLLNPDEPLRELLNPITADMAVMRTNLWPGLINTLIYNANRQQHRARLFEIGICFKPQEETMKLAGLLTGLAYPEQWGRPGRVADFYDLKGDVETILRSHLPFAKITFKPDQHPALHPGQTAAVYYSDQKIGILGLLHPLVRQSLDLPKDFSSSILVFELDLAALTQAHPSHFKEISKFPEIRRDIAILINEAIPAKAIQDTITSTAGDWLKDVFIFDVYQGKRITPGLKSVALGLMLQHPTRTLVDDEVATLVNRVIAALKGQFGAELRS